MCCSTGCNCTCLPVRPLRLVKVETFSLAEGWALAPSIFYFQPNTRWTTSRCKKAEAGLQGAHNSRKLGMLRPLQVATKLQQQPCSKPVNGRTHWVNIVKGAAGRGGAQGWGGVAHDASQGNYGFKLAALNLNRGRVPTTHSTAS